MDHTNRFSTRADDYVRYRPGYPADILQFLTREASMTSRWIVADIGSGTGISTELFLKHGNRVYAVEPNAAMRSKAEALLRRYPNFSSVDGTAEQTGLLSSSINLIVSAQAFHWFDRTKTKREFQRITAPDGYTTLIWNNRRHSTEFERAYEEFLLSYGTDYETVKNLDPTDEEIAEWFRPNPVKTQTFNNVQVFDFIGLRGRALSSSYIPKESHPKYAAMIAALRQLFERYNQDGEVRFTYDTKVYLGSIH